MWWTVGAYRGAGAADVARVQVIQQGGRGFVASVAVWVLAFLLGIAYFVTLRAAIDG